MSNEYEAIIVPVGGTTDVCLSQSVLTNGYLNLSGTTGGNFLANGYMRTLSFTCADDISGMYFIVVGLQNGAAITENVYGGTGTGGTMTVYSANYYDKIFTIQASGAATALTVGAGSTTRIFYDAGSNFSSSFGPSSYFKMSIDNPSGVTSNTTTRVDALNGFPEHMLNWAPDSATAIAQGTRSVKAEDRMAQWDYSKANLELYRGFIVTIEGFPTDSVYVHISQP